MSAMEVRAMMLTWRDAVSTLVMGAVIAVYLAFLGGTHLWLISSARGAAAVMLILGVAGGCALSTAVGLATASDSAVAGVYLALVGLLGAAALAAAVMGMVTGSPAALAALVVLTVTLWLVATVRHAFTLPAFGAGGRGGRPARHRGLAHR